MNWRVEPKKCDFWDEESDYVIAIDENGSSDLSSMSKGSDRNEHNKWFTLTGIYGNKESFVSLKDSIVNLKERHWENGMYCGKRVVLHSREIRNKVGPFSPKNIDYQKFIDELFEIIDESDFNIISISVDKHRHLDKYPNPYAVYEYALELMLERYCYDLDKEQSKGDIIVEARGKKDDKKSLISIIDILNNGNIYNNKRTFKCINGVYFNPKRAKDKKKSYYLLEIADVISYPIYKYVQDGTRSDLFDTIEKKFDKFPAYYGKGLKVFPKESKGEWI